MFLFGLAAGFRDQSPHAERLGALMAGTPAVPPDSTVTARGEHASAGVARWVVVERDETAAPSWDPARGLLFAGDVRLYNRPELIADLDESAEMLRRASDLELARLAYLRWGQAAPSHLVGDFAFVAWEERSRSLFAARDHFGLRPLHYRQVPDGIAVASDVRQLLNLVERPGDELSSEKILDGLLRRSTDPRRTYFRGITTVAPGHAVVADAGGARQARYWLPPAPSDPPAPYADTCAELRALFRRAVRDRLESDRPVLAHSSGGFDSSTIVMAADEIYRAEPSRPLLTTLSAVAPGFPADESHYIDAVAAQVGFPGVRWNVFGAGPLPNWRVAKAAPIFRQGLGGGPRRDLEVAHERGARVLLSGVLGDSLWHATGVRRDMVRHGRWPQVAFDILRAGVGGIHRRLFDAGLGVLGTRAALHLGHSLLRPPPSPPEWMGPDLRSIFSRAVAISRTEPPDRAAASVSHLYLGLWSRLTSPGAARIVEAFVDYAADDGVELRAPHTDVRLVEAVLRIPWRQREPKGHHRRTGRDALGPLLPAALRSRIDQQPWTEAWAANARRTALSVAALVDHGPWLSAPFVDRGIARAMLRDVAEGRDRDRPQVPILVADFGCLEAWLRDLFGYNTGPEVADAG